MVERKKYIPKIRTDTNRVYYPAPWLPDSVRTAGMGTIVERFPDHCTVMWDNGNATKDVRYTWIRSVETPPK